MRFIKYDMIYYNIKFTLIKTDVQTRVRVISNTHYSGHRILKNDIRGGPGRKIGIELNVYDSEIGLYIHLSDSSLSQMGLRVYHPL